jgi:hypothetical protein
MNEAMKKAWAEVTMFYEDPTAEDFDAFLRTWQLAIKAERQRFAEQCIDLVATYGGSVDLEAAIRARGEQ